MKFIFIAEQKKVYSCSPVKGTFLPKKTPHIFFFLQLLCLSTFAQTKISGVVKNDKGEAITGVSVNLKQTSIGTITDQNGKYALSFPPKGILVFSHIGYVKQEINVNNRTSINVVLVSQTTSLNEVTVVGYGTQKKTSLTSAVADIKGEDMNKRSVADVTLSKLCYRHQDRS